MTQELRDDEAGIRELERVMIEDLASLKSKYINLISPFIQQKTNFLAKREGLDFVFGKKEGLYLIDTIAIPQIELSLTQKERKEMRFFAQILQTELNHILQKYKKHAQPSTN